MQRLVATLVASKPGGRIAEIGTSYGGGAQAIVAALPAEATFVTVELDAERAARAAEALAGTPAEVVQGDWLEVLPGRGPFDLVFADGGVAYDRVADLLAPGGILVKDDLTPGRPVAGDATREALLGDPRLEATELMVTPEMAVIVAVRRT
ncbi:MAG TPA: class I SAM-dependent methyltransferase [Gaiellaceae bacterium]|nr:class I SAM-dependent methyltransferase [Gaiellaceae bacterium]